MATKRKFQLDEDEDLQTLNISNKKHTLDSDEEDSDEYEKEELHDSDVEGVEDGEATIQDEIKITPFNMREELEEGHFDKEGQYHWDKDAEIKDNWLDNIDWVKVKTDKNYLDPKKDDDSNGAADLMNVFNESGAYREVLAFMQPRETVQKTLQRLGKGRVKISSAERLRRKKAGIVDEDGEKITKFTELTNEILTRTGNMDIYQETYEQIKTKINSLPGTSGAATATAAAGDEFDMYADDFEEKEKSAIAANQQQGADEDDKADAVATTAPTPPLRWEYKVKQSDTKIEGPFTTEQMLRWTEEKRFKDGIYVRKVGESTHFYSSQRIDFDLYL